MAAGDPLAAPAPVGRGEVELWLVDLAATAPILVDIEAQTPRLPVALPFAPSSPTLSASNERRAAHIALRIVLERRLGPAVRGCAFPTGRYGKPSLPAGFPSIDFSLAHCPGHALIALSWSGPVGVDIERPRKLHIPPRRAATICAAGAALVPASPPLGTTEADLLRAWVRLEAYAKADGRGIGRLLTALGILGRPRPDVTPATDGLVAIDWPIDWPNHRVSDLDTDVPLFAALATTAGPSAAPEVHHFPDTADGILHMSR